MPRVYNPASLDSMFDALRSPTRRRVLLAISENNPREITEFTQNKFAPANRDEADREQLELQLHHLHLPKLAENGYIDWTPEVRTIRRGSNFDDIEPLLKLIDDHADELPADWP